MSHGKYYYYYIISEEQIYNLVRKKTKIESDFWKASLSAVN